MAAMVVLPQEDMAAMEDMAAVPRMRATEETEETEEMARAATAAMVITAMTRGASVALEPAATAARVARAAHRMAAQEATVRMAREQMASTAYRVPFAHPEWSVIWFILIWITTVTAILKTSSVTVRTSQLVMWRIAPIAMTIMHLFIPEQKKPPITVLMKIVMAWTSSFTRVPGTGPRCWVSFPTLLRG